uniref:Uncharacterized protein n=1 Tax=Peronospora matthiolae TaxID=2874970 RepID=A0AAV1TM34_9STRA
MPFNSTTPPVIDLRSALSPAKSASLHHRKFEASTLFEVPRNALRKFPFVEPRSVSLPGGLMSHERDVRPRAQCYPE